MILGDDVCDNCALRFGRHSTPCPGCGGMKVLAFYDSAGRPACAACCGAEPVYGCASCGREDSPFGTRCGHCVLAERAAALLAAPGGEIHPRLRPVHEALLAARRPRSVIYWLGHSTGPAILRSMATGDVDISHAAFERLPADKATRHVRQMLASVGALPPFDARLEQIIPWLAETVRPLPPDQADLIERFARWQVLRTRRDQARRGVLTGSSIENGRAAIVTAVRFLAWLNEHAKTLATANQTDLDRYLADHPGRGEMLVLFVAWSVRSGLAGDLQMPRWRRGPPAVLLGEEDRWRHVERLLHDPTIALQVRVAGLLTLLFAQPLTRICRMETSQIRQDGDRVTVDFGTFPIELPGPLDQLVVDQIAGQGHSSYPDGHARWVFPGAVPGHHLSTETVRSQLVARGIHPSDARKAAMFQLAGEIPTPVLSDILGLGTNTATRWAALAARDWSQYAAQRRSDQALIATAPADTQGPARGQDASLLAAQIAPDTDR